MSKPRIENNIDPGKIMTPDIDPKFWDHHGNSKENYIDLIDKLHEFNQLIEHGESIEEIAASRPELSNAHDIFVKNPIRLLKLGDYYMVEEDGRHRVAAAKISRKNIKLTAQVIDVLSVSVHEKKSG